MKLAIWFLAVATSHAQGKLGLGTVFLTFSSFSRHILGYRLEILLIIGILDGDTNNDPVESAMVPIEVVEVSFQTNGRKLKFVLAKTEEL